MRISFNNVGYRALFSSFVIGLSLCLYGCVDQRKKSLEKDLQLMYEQEMILPIDSMQAINGQYFNYSSEKPIMTIVSFVDSSLCSSCAIEDLDDWIPLIDKIKNYSRTINLYFIFDVPRDYVEETINKAQLVSSRIKVPIYLDIDHSFKKNNVKLCKSPYFSVFSLDENNKIKIVGHPVYNKKIHEILWKEIETKNNY